MKSQQQIRTIRAKIRVTQPYAETISTCVNAEYSSVLIATAIHDQSSLITLVRAA